MKINEARRYLQRTSPRTQVLSYLRAHPDEVFTPAQVGAALDISPDSVRAVLSAHADHVYALTNGRIRVLLCGVPSAIARLRASIEGGANAD